MEVPGWRAAGWRKLDWRGLDGGKWLDGGRLDGVKMRLGWRGSMSCVVSRGSRFCSSQGWTVPGGSVPVCGSVHGLPANPKQGALKLRADWRIPKGGSLNALKQELNGRNLMGATIKQGTLTEEP